MPTPRGDGGGGTDSGNDGGTTNPGPGPVPDELAAIDATPDPSCSATWIVGHYGIVLDESGRGLGGAKVQLCMRLGPDGNLLCLSPADSNPDGSFAQEIPESARCVQHAAMRVLVPLAARPTTYCEVELTVQDGVLAVWDPLVLFNAQGATTIPPQGDAEASRTVVFADGLELDVVPSKIAAPADYTALAARRLERDRFPCFAEGVSLDGLYGFVPEANIDGDFPIRIPNTDGLAAGSRVDLYVLGGLSTTLPSGQALEEADFVPYGTATVSADGAFIASDSGSGLPYLSWLGYKAR